MVADTTVLRDAKLTLLQRFGPIGNGNKIAQRITRQEMTGILDRIQHPVETRVLQPARRCRPLDEGLEGGTRLATLRR